MNFPARQHTVPKMLQKRFVDRDGLLWFHDKRRPAQGVRRAQPKDLFVEGHVYTIEDEAGGRSAAVESLLGRVEDAAEPIVEMIVDRTRRRLPLDLSADDRAIILLFVHYQMRRSPDLYRRITLDADVQKLFEDSVDEWKQARGAVEQAERARILDPRNVARNAQRVRMQGLAQISEKIMGALDARGLCTALISRPNQNFVLGGFPFARFAAGGRTDLGHPNVELWLTLAPDVALGSYGHRSDERRAEITNDRAVRDVNSLISRGSHVIASASADLVRAVARRNPTKDFLRQLGCPG
ncbi:DUF4238 domain-containing protein [Methylobacterium thuringiense]|uniref:DUF4238 domain-containing protein n=1 Tax=Methylobacterium thuringiense TaxID=1003091 RepID=A0ABQ4TNP2_9HYPH|nr:DUF4238 domain-containing protein [Methylobacterium thuringiense]GJE56954.1 hypothetical protein EKPJFOCH_3464 [Methylobacterium thuringiense]